MSLSGKNIIFLLNVASFGVVDTFRDHSAPLFIVIGVYMCILVL
jgi:hypothetical protein